MNYPGRPTDALVQSIDIYPTLAKLCGLAPPKDIDGRTFLDLLNDPSLRSGICNQLQSIVRRSLWGQPRMYAVTLRSRDYRYTQWQKDLGRGDIIFQELYDHRSDPDEVDNLAAKKPKMIKQFAELITEHVMTKH